MKNLSIAQTIELVRKILTAQGRWELYNPNYCYNCSEGYRKISHGYDERCPLQKSSSKHQ